MCNHVFAKSVNGNKIIGKRTIRTRKNQKSTINYSSCYAHKGTKNNRQLVNHYIFNLVISASFTPLQECNMNTIYDQSHNTTRLPTLK